MRGWHWSEGFSLSASATISIFFDANGYTNNWGDKGAFFLTESLDNHGWEWPCYMRDPDGYLVTTALRPGFLAQNTRDKYVNPTQEAQYKTLSLLRSECRRLSGSPGRHVRFLAGGRAGASRVRGVPRQRRCSGHGPQDLAL
jgi:hypothetical protein